MTKIVGLTGGIGSGKTTVAKMFQELGIPIYIADTEARTITNQPKTLALIAEEFGTSVIDNGQLDRVEMAKIVFNSPEKLNLLNAIIHPLVGNHFKEWLLQHHAAPFIIKETAILFETRGHLLCDYVITVTAPMDVRIGRVQNRDHSSEAEIQKRIDNQWPDAQRIELSDFVITNNRIESTLQQVNDIYNKILKFL